MSHVVTCKVELKNANALQKAISHLKLENLGVKEHELYGGQRANGVAVKLPSWKYPVVINPETGEAKYDNYGGSWGKQEELDKLVQRYAVETQLQAAEEYGYVFQQEELQENGDVVLHFEELVTT